MKESLLQIIKDTKKETTFCLRLYHSDSYVLRHEPLYVDEDDFSQIRTLFAVSEETFESCFPMWKMSNHTCARVIVSKKDKCIWIVQNSCASV